VNIVLWILQVLLGIYFLMVGVMHFVIPPGLPASMSWMYDLAPGLHYFSGVAEILAGLGLILPGLFKRYTWLTPLAAAGLVLVMLGAAVFHITRGEYPNIVQNIILAALAAFVAYGRWKLRPLEDRSPSVA
jgi:putative oxidoreductase